MLAAFLNSLNAVGLIIMMIAVGFFANKLKLMKAEYKPFIVKYVVNFAVPAMCISNVFTKFASLDIKNPLILFVPPILSMLATLVIALIAAKLFKLSHKRFGAFVIMCAFSNSMFVGLPMCKELFGEAGVPYVIIFYIINTMMFWTVGIALLQRSAADQNSHKGFNLLETLKHLATPPLISLLISIILLLVGVKSLPHIVMTFCGYLGDTVSPLILTYVGFLIAEADWHSFKISGSFSFAMFMRFVVAPITMILICKPFGLSGMIRGVFTAEAAMPVMTQCVIMTAAYGGDEEYVASAMTISTLLCLVFIPLLMLLLEVI